VLRAAAATDRGSRGLPVGVQVVGGPDADEAIVLDVMAAIEAGE
jgi:Asp-tRNA(Asn)/Glu-tRNA(Gln) amidotransferase A subunit family amidase